MTHSIYQTLRCEYSLELSCQDNYSNEYPQHSICKSTYRIKFHHPAHILNSMDDIMGICIFGGNYDC